MNKRCLIIPLIATFLVCSGCNSSSAKRGNKQIVSTSQKNTEPENTNIHYAGQVAQGANHPVPWTIDYESFKDPTGALSYDAYHKTYDFSGTNIYAYGMRAVTEIARNVGGSLVQYRGFKVIHLCAFAHEKYPDGGQLQISDVQANKLILEIVSYRTYDPNGTFTVIAGGKRISAPENPPINDSTVNPEFKVQFLEFPINATSPQLVKIHNAQKISQYIQAIRFE